MSPLTYAFWSQIRDRATRDAMKVLLDRVAALETQATSIGTVSKPLTANLDAASHRLTAVANPTADTDAVNLLTLKRYVEGRLNQIGVTDQSGQAAVVQETDGGQTQAGVAASDATTGHPTGSGLTAYNAGLIIGGVAKEFPALGAAVANQDIRNTNQEELLRRTIWHLQQFGFTAGRQRNPSGAISLDKLCVISDGQLRCFDCYTGTYDTTMIVQAFQVYPPSLVADAGIAD